MKKLLVFLTAAAMSIAAAAESYKVTLFQESVISGTTLKPGDYKVMVDGNTATIAAGKHKVEAPVTVENADSKFSATSVRYQTADGKYRVKEIRLGGTSTKLVFAVN
ncbi:MAG: hypothetical protein IT163_02045 [Bryobacterales bacterium]|nr:hypothetical protein [Bryobacterales bacterium]